jgi:hypothetical protein
MLLVISIGLALLMGAALYRLFFRDFADFIDCVRFWFQPDLISILRDEWQQDMWGTMKLGVWLTISMLMGIAAFSKLPDIFPQLTPARESVAYNHKSSERAPAPYIPPPVSARTRTNGQAAVPARQFTSNQSLPPQALQYEVKPGDVVELSALKPAVALRRATVVSMNTNEIAVQTTSGSYTILWKDVMRLRQAAKSSR